MIVGADASNDATILDDRRDALRVVRAAARLLLGVQPHSARLGAAAGAGAAADARASALPGRLAAALLRLRARTSSRRRRRHARPRDRSQARLGARASRALSRRRQSRRPRDAAARARASACATSSASWPRGAARRCATPTSSSCAATCARRSPSSSRRTDVPRRAATPRPNGCARASLRARRAARTALSRPTSDSLAGARRARCSPPASPPSTCTVDRSAAPSLVRRAGQRAARLPDAALAHSAAPRGRAPSASPAIAIRRAYALMYRVLWRVVHGEPRLLDDAADDDVVGAHAPARRVDPPRATR